MIPQGPSTEATASNQSSVFTFTLPLGREGEAWEPSNKMMLLVRPQNKVPLSSPLLHLFTYSFTVLPCLSHSLSSGLRGPLYSLVTGLLARSLCLYPAGLATGHLDTGFLGFPLSSSTCWDGSVCYCLLLMQPSHLKFLNIEPVCAEYPQILQLTPNNEIRIPHSFSTSFH
jgi:hypothetical protein